MSAAPRAEHQLVGRVATLPGVTNQVADPALRVHMPGWWWIGVVLSAIGLLFGAAGIWALFAEGVGVFGNNWPVMWGFPLVNYVWWIAIASGGTFTSALLYLTGAEYRTSINRIAETMTLFAAACAAIYPILHLGRPWLFYWLFPYPNTMGLWPQFKSPLLWDFAAILTYVVTSVLFWWVGLLPDLATLRDRTARRGRQLFYGILALGWRGSARQWRAHRQAYGLIAALMAPLVVSVHSIVGLDFAGGLAPGWHSTQFPPFFVFGALYSGFATVILLAIAVRRLLRLQDYITDRHFDTLGKLLIASSLAIGYAYAMEAFDAFYTSSTAERVQYLDRVTGTYAPFFWATILLNVALPHLLWSRRRRTNQLLLGTICAGAVLGMWYERVLIVAQSLHRHYTPSSWGNFAPTPWDWAIMFGGTGGLFFGGLLIAGKLLPMMSMYEARELVVRKVTKAGAGSA